MKQITIPIYDKTTKMVVNMTVDTADVSSCSTTKDPNLYRVTIKGVDYLTTMSVTDIWSTLNGGMGDF